MPAPDVGPLRLEDGEGRALPLHGPVARAAGPPYAVSVAPGGRFLAVAGRTSGADDAAAVVALHALPLGDQVAAWYLAAGTEVRSLRVSPDGGAVAARVGGRTPDEAARWELLQRGRRGTVGTVGGEALHDVAFAPDGRHVAVATASLVALVLDAATLVPLGRLPLPPTRALAWTAGPPPPLPADGR